jgi:hypothetical protein
MNETWGAIIVLVLIALSFTGMILAWRKKAQRDSRFSLSVPGSPISDKSDIETVYSCLYVATTLATDPLMRISIPGLTYRAQCSIGVSSAGMSISPEGEKTSFIPTSQLIQLHRAQVAIDRVVEKDGLTAVSWNAFDTQIQDIVELTSFFRFQDFDSREECESSIQKLIDQNKKEVTS